MYMNPEFTSESCIHKEHLLNEISIICYSILYNRYITCLANIFALVEPLGLTESNIQLRPPVQRIFHPATHQLSSPPV